MLHHSGERFHPLLYSRFTHPLEFDQVAVDFPRLKMILGHAGGLWWEDCATIARVHENVVVDLAEWQTKLRDKPQETLAALDHMRHFPRQRTDTLGYRLPAHAPADVAQGHR